MQVGNNVHGTDNAPPGAKAGRRATNQVLNHWHNWRRSEAVPTLVDLVPTFANPGHGGSLSVIAVATSDCVARVTAITAPGRGLD